MPSIRSREYFEDISGSGIICTTTEDLTSRFDLTLHSRGIASKNGLLNNRLGIILERSTSKF